MRRIDARVLEAARTLAASSPFDDGFKVISNAADEAEVLLYGRIGLPGGVDTEEFVRNIKSIKAKRITLRVHSVGGDVHDGYAIYNAVKGHPAYVTAIVDGIAASAGAFISMAGDKILMHQAADLMIHDAMVLTIGTADEYRRYADRLDKMSDQIAAIFAARAGGTTEEWRATMKDETWYTADEALEAGLIDAVIEDGQVETDARAKQPQVIKARAVANQLAQLEAEAARYLDPEPDDDELLSPEEVDRQLTELSYEVARYLAS
jgi:ATP-dependent protease ClpP protease subunit